MVPSNIGEASAQSFVSETGESAEVSVEDDSGSGEYSFRVSKSRTRCCRRKWKRTFKVIRLLASVVFACIPKLL